MPADERSRRLRAANDSTITLNHVVHHGALGHHVQNYHAAAARHASARWRRWTARAGSACSRAVRWPRVGVLRVRSDGGDGLPHAARVAPRSSTHGCACWPALSPISSCTSGRARSTRPRRSTAIAADAGNGRGAEPKRSKNSMFPGAAVMYWLGTRGIHALRRTCEARDGARFTLQRLSRSAAVLRRDPGAAHCPADDAEGA